MLPVGVFLYTGAGGGGPATDLFPSSVEAAYQSVGVPVQMGDDLPAHFAEQFSVLEILNPLMAVPADVSSAASTLVTSGGRVVVVMEHCKDGCYGDATDDNTLLASMGSTMQLLGTGGAPLAVTALALTPTSPITDGVTTLDVYYAGSVSIGSGVAVGTVPGGDVVVGYERVGQGDVVVVADSDPFGYVMSMDDDTRFVQNLAIVR